MSKAKAIVGALHCRDGCGPLLTRRPPRRAYAAVPPPPSTATAAPEGPKPKTISGAIIIPASLKTHPRHLFQSIKALPLEDALRKTFTVFFVTPSYAHFLLDDDSFLHDALLRIYGGVTDAADLSIHALCAVVDKVPAPRPWKSHSFEDEVSWRRVQPPIAGAGFEGIAYVSLRPGASVSPSGSLSPSENGAIDFITADYFSDGAAHLDTLRLPLANTVFQTGTPTTMFQSTWQTHGTPGKLTLLAKTNTSHHAIRLDHTPYSLHDTSALNIPLFPLTLPRVVEGCMGNIIRRVLDADGNSVQASSELEDAVPRFFAARGRPSQATVAWALVIPSSLKDKVISRTEELFSNLPTKDDATPTEPEHAWERLWCSRPPAWNTLVSQAISEGARLHRVLSGGGGWGKKAGLLSLDPVPVYGPPESIGSDAAAVSDDPSDFESTLTPVVRDGDSIQFFILPKAMLDHEARQFDNYTSVTRLTRKGKLWGWELGTVPSTMDSIPGKSWQHQTARKTAYTLFNSSFGALTEGAMTLTRRSWTRQGGISSVHTTMLDVPFSRFWTVNSTKMRVKHLNPEQKDMDGAGKDKDVGEPGPE
ncbi:hypothetical protein ACJQWK_08030 [Exserohilum turcicum]